jgi:hypothetical protein
VLWDQEAQGNVSCDELNNSLTKTKGCKSDLFKSPCTKIEGPGTLSQFRANRFDHFPVARNYTKGRERATVDYFLAVDKNFVLGVTSVNHIHVDAELTFELRCHTGSV